ncbi:MAG: hypothetical protein K6F92_05460 [Lachnospiraceae bacterium]|nr:hypothetical protein [Lachnospiraceae bacterium]
MAYCYRFDYRFNAMHNPNKSEHGAHPHTFGVTCELDMEESEQDAVYGAIRDYLGIYKGRNLNDIMYDTYIEDIAETLFKDIDALTKDRARLMKLEFSDKPVQVYVIERRITSDKE